MKRRPKSTEYVVAGVKSHAQSRLLVELAELLLGHGITPALLHEVMDQAFVRAAARGARLKNGRVNYSRIAAKTGLPRAAIRQLIHQEIPTRHALSPLDQVIHGWRTDSDFLDDAGRPKPILLSGQHETFVQLVKKYAGDIPQRALLQEMIDGGFAARRGNLLRLRGYKRRGCMPLYSAKYVSSFVTTILRKIRMEEAPRLQGTGAQNNSTIVLTSRAVPRATPSSRSSRRSS